MGILEAIPFLRRKRAEALNDPRFGLSFGRVIPGSDVDANPIGSKREAAETYAGWVFAASTFIAEEIRAAEWTLKRRDGRSSDQWTEVLDGPVVEKLREPNRSESWGDLIERSDISFSVAGEFFWHIIRDNTQALGIQLVLPHWVDEPTFDRDGRHAGWRITIPGRAPQVLPVEDIVRVYRPHPLNPWMAASPVEAAAVSHYFDLYMRAYGMTLFRNDGGVPAGVLSSDQELTPDQADDMRERWRQRYSQSRGEVAVLGKNAKYEPIAIPMQQLKFLEVGEFTKTQIMEMFRVPPSLLGSAGDVNRASIDAHLYSFQRHVLRPRLSRYAEAIRTRVIPEFAGIETRRLWFGFEGVVMKDRDQVRTEAKESLEAGAITVNEYRERLDMDPTQGGDVYLLPNTHTISGSLEPQEPQQEPAREPPDPTAGLIAAAARRRAQRAEEEAKELRIQASERRHYQDLRGLFASWWRNRNETGTITMTGLEERGLERADLPDAEEGESLHGWIERLKGPEGKRLARMLAEREEA